MKPSLPEFTPQRAVVSPMPFGVLFPAVPLLRHELDNHKLDY